MTYFELFLLLVGILIVAGLFIKFAPNDWVAPGGKKMIGIFALILCVIIFVSVVWPNVGRTLDAPVKQIKP